MTKDEMPPEWMWGVDHELEIWFERVMDEREERYGGGDSRPDTPMMDNEYAAELRKQRG